MLEHMSDEDLKTYYRELIDLTLRIDEDRRLQSGSASALIMLLSRGQTTDESTQQEMARIQRRLTQVSHAHTTLSHMLAEARDELHRRSIDLLDAFTSDDTE